MTQWTCSNHWRFLYFLPFLFSGRFHSSTTHKGFLRVLQTFFAMIKTKSLGRLQLSHAKTIRSFTNSNQKADNTAIIINRSTTVSKYALWQYKGSPTTQQWVRTTSCASRSENAKIPTLCGRFLACKEPAMLAPQLKIHLFCEGHGIAFKVKRFLATNKAQVVHETNNEGVYASMTQWMVGSLGGRSSHIWMQRQRTSYTQNQMRTMKSTPCIIKNTINKHYHESEHRRMTTMNQRIMRAQTHHISHNNRDETVSSSPKIVTVRENSEEQRKILLWHELAYKIIKVPSLLRYNHRLVESCLLCW